MKARLQCENVCVTTEHQVGYSFDCLHCSSLCAGTRMPPSLCESRLLEPSIVT